MITCFINFVLGFELEHKPPVYPEMSWKFWLSVCFFAEGQIFDLRVALDYGSEGTLKSLGTVHWGPLISISIS